MTKTYLQSPKQQPQEPTKTHNKTLSRLDAIGAIGIARCFTFGGARGRVLHDPSVPPRLAGALTKQAYMEGAERATTINHFHEKLLLLKGMMKTAAGRRRAEARHERMVAFLRHFEEEWAGLA